ncbi:family 2 glycosyl transferase [Flavobacterium limnosediminis JC2902]|uniref:Family 2 glycosyl transferase n=1 Tax=Flavobacterium limnosediminis JC2902 TaxID=1341181 RepID=V6SNE5_9FLAO|nr:family 2 glycosyl transferase [Flavobacterium limnosediminis JC2902]
MEQLSFGAADVWHSSFEQGYKNAFPEIVYFAVVFSWYVHDFDDLEECISWRINPNNFAVRKSVWEAIGGFDNELTNESLQALDFGYNLLKNSGGIPLYVKGLYKETTNDLKSITAKERHVFFRKNFKPEHAVYMNFRKGFWKVSEWDALLEAKKYEIRNNYPLIAPRKLNEIVGKPSVSYIIPTMLRQDFTLTLLEDLKKQTYLPSQVIVVDATPEDKRDEQLYNEKQYPFEVIFNWQTTKGSCRARNEAIELCSGDYIVFGDDDIRIPSDFIENHIRLLQTYKAGACNGLDIRADHQKQTLEDLDIKLAALGNARWKVGATPNFSNANSCVKREFVSLLEGNDINYDGGYGEDGDFGMSLVKIGVTVLFNPFAANLHLKPPAGGYRFWGNQAKILGKKRKQQPWELDTPVKRIRPVPSPTIMYLIQKQFDKSAFYEYRVKYFVLYFSKGKVWEIPLKLIKLPYRILQFNKSVFYAKKLVALGKRTK